MTAKLLPCQKISLFGHQQLREKLECFYNSSNEYTPFKTPSDQRSCWEHLVVEIGRRLKDKSTSKLKILEVGAGKTGFGLFLNQQSLRRSIEYHVQDITRINEVWLRNQADSVFFGDVLMSKMISGYDIIFSTYVLEHVTNPPAHLDRLWSLLDSRGDLFIFSPRYDLPGYICPSARHLCKIKQFQFGLQAIVARLFSWITKQPQFLIQNDLAAFYLPFYSDSDAVHWVFLQDIEAWAAHRKASLKRLKLGQPAFPSKDWLIKRFCTLAVQISVNSHAS